jgi:MFS family permease
VCRLRSTVLLMSTLPPPRTTQSDAPARLLSLPLALAFLAEFTSLTSFFLLLSALPMLAAAAGASNSGAGLMTGSLLLGTVAAEASAAAGIRRFGYRTMLAAGAALLGAPALALLPGEPQAVMMAVSFVRGAGFGLCGVTVGALTAALLPPGRRGEGLGLLGIVSGVPAVIALPAGVWLAGHHLAMAVAVMAAATGLLPLAAIRWLPGRAEARSTPPATRRAPGAALRLPLIFAACTVAAGVLASFLPLTKGVPSSLSSAALLIQAVTATLSRWQAGRHGDRYGHAALLVPALIVTALGMTALIWLASPVLMFGGMVLFGAGFGVIESATFALLIEQLPEARASALWNLAYDAGYGAGPAVFGLFAARTGYPAAFALTGVVVLAALPAARPGRLWPRRGPRPGLCRPPGDSHARAFASSPGTDDHRGWRPVLRRHPGASSRQPAPRRAGPALPPGDELGHQPPGLRVTGRSSVDHR